MANVQRILSCFMLMSSLVLAVFFNLVGCVDSPPGGFDSQKLDRCTSDADCHGGTCAIDGRCVGDNDNEGNDCDNNADCNGDDVCRNGDCVDPDNDDEDDDECDNDNDCDDDEECDDGECVDDDDGNDDTSTDQTEDPRDVEFGVDEDEANLTLTLRFEGETGTNYDQITMNGDVVSVCPGDNGFLDDVAGGWTEPIDSAEDVDSFTFHARLPASAMFFRGSFTLYEDGRVAGWSCTGYRTRIGRGELTAEWDGEEVDVAIVSVLWENEDGDEEAGCGFVVELGNQCRQDFPDEVDLTSFSE